MKPKKSELGQFRWGYPQHMKSLDFVVGRRGIDGYLENITEQPYTGNPRITS